MDNALHRTLKGLLALALLAPALAFAAKFDCSPVKIAPNGSLPNATAGAAYSTTLTATEGVNPFSGSYTVTRGTLPPNITLSAAGAFGGTPTAAGNTPFRVTVVNPATGCSGSREYVLHVDPSAGNAPSFTPGGNQTVNEDAGAQSVAWATSISDNDGNTQTLNFTVDNNTNAALFSVAPAISPTGTLTYTPAADANGSADITVTLHDSGASNNASAPATFTINVTAVNDAPSFTKGPDQNVFESSGLHTVTSWATAMSVGPANESSQTLLNFNVTNNANALFSVQPTVAVDGTLSYTLAAGQSGTAIVSVSLQDNGGTANGGVDTSAVQTFNIVVNPINHAPTFTSGGNVTVNEDSGAYSAGWATAINDNDGGTQTPYSFLVTNNTNAALFTVQPSISATGVLSFTPVAEANGTATVTVELHDSGGTANGGTDTSTPVSFTITVAAVNDAPVNTVPTDASVGTAFSNTALAISGVSIADIDAASGTMTTAFSAVSGGLTFSLAGGASVSAGVNGTSSVTLSGTLTQLNAALSTLSYKSNDGFTGTDTLTLLTNDGGNTGSGGPKTDTDTFHVGVVPQVFIIDNTDTTSDALSTAGTLANPYNSIASFNTNAIDGVGDYIYLKKGTGTYSEASGFTLLNNEQLLGEGQTLQFTNPVTGAVVTVGTGSAANTPTISITGASQIGVTLAQSNTLKGFNVATTLGSQTGVADGGGTVGGLTVSDVDVTGSGMAVDIDQGSGVMNVVFDTLSSSGSTQQGVQLAGTTLAGTFTGTTGAISGSTGTGFLVGDGSGTANTGGTVAITYGGTISTTGTARAVDIEDRAAAAGTITLSGNISHASGNGIGIFIADIAAGAITLSGSNTLNTGTANAIQVGTVTGGSLTLSGNQDIDTTSGKGISLSGNTVAVSFSGSQITVNTTSGNGIDIATNSGTVSFANAGNGLDVVTTAGGAGIIAASSGTLTITGTSNTISSAGAPALSVATTGIGAAGLNFVSISANGGANGIVLNTTGGAGGLTVSGTGVAPSGGTIQSTTGAGILLTSTLNPSFNSMLIQNTTGSGIKGTTVSNFFFDKGQINTTGSVGTADDSNIAFNTNVTGTENNASGTFTVTNSTLTNAAWHGIDVMSFNGTISNLVVTGNTFVSPTSTATSKGSAIRIQTLGSATTSSSLTKATIDNNDISNFPSGAGIMVQGGNSNAAGPNGSVGTAGSGTDVVAITNNKIKGLSAAVKMGTSAIIVATSGKGQGNFNITGNGTLALPLTNMAGIAIGVGTNGNTTATVTTANNVVVANNTVGSGGISGGTGITFGASDTPNLTWTITGNNLSGVDGNGILAVARGASGSLKAKIQNNTVAAPLTGVRPGIRVDAGNASSVDDSVCLNISGNTSAGSGGSQGIGLRKQGTTTTTNDFSVNGMAATATPGVETYVNGLNPAGNNTLLISATSGFSNCSLP